MPKVFLSYSHTDRDAAASIAHSLGAAGHAVWWDEQALAPGDHWRTELDTAIAAADVAVLLISLAAASSQSTRSEWQRALASGSRVVPVLLPGFELSALPPELRHIQALKYRDPASIADAITSSLRHASPQTADTRAHRVSYRHKPYGAVADAIATAEYRVSFAGDGIEGVFRALPTALDALAMRGVTAQIVLPDPNVIRLPERGAQLEAASRSAQALALIRRASDRGAASVWLASGEVRQSILIVDDRAFFEPMPSSPLRGGVIEASRGGRAAGLFAVVEAEFERLASVARSVASRDPLGRPLPREGRSSAAAEFELSDFARQYLDARNYTVVSSLHRESGFDFAISSPDGELAIAEVKASKREISADVLQKLARSGAEVGATRLLLFAYAGLSKDGARFAERLEADHGLTVDVITPGDDTTSSGGEVRDAR